MRPQPLKKPLALAILCLSLLSCKAQDKVVPISDSQPEKSASIDNREQQAAKLWKKVRGRQTCNLLNGCSPAKELIALGPDVAAQVGKKITKLKQADHWRISLLRELRFVRDSRVQAAQRQMLQDKNWPIRTYAAVGLGYSRDNHFKDQIKAALKSDLHYAVRLGYLWALATIDPRIGRAAAVEHLKSFIDSPDIRIHLVALDAIRSLKMVEVRALVRSWLKHSNFFVVRDAIITVRDLYDRSAIPSLIPLIEHEQPMVKREALKTLQKFTGLKHANKEKAFKVWCEKHCVKP